MKTVPRIITDFSKIDKRDWDQLDHADNPFLSHAFLNALEASASVSADTGWQPHHLGLYQGDQLVAFAPTYIKSHSHGEFVFDWAWAVYDARAIVTQRLVAHLAIQLREYKAAAVLLYPGWTRREDMIAAVEAGQLEQVVTSMEELVEKTASPHYAGRAAVMLAVDRNLLDRTGQLVTSADLAREFGFTDVDGRQPDPT